MCVCMCVCMYVCVYVCIHNHITEKRKKNNYVAGMRRRRARRWTPRGEKQLEESCPLGLGRWACRTGKTCLRKKKEKRKNEMSVRSRALGLSYAGKTCLRKKKEKSKEALTSTEF